MGGGGEKWSHNVCSGARGIREYNANVKPIGGHSCYIVLQLEIIIKMCQVFWLLLPLNNDGYPIDSLYDVYIA